MQYEAIKNEQLHDVFIRSHFDFSKFEKPEIKPKEVKIAAKEANAVRFKDMLSNVLNHNLPAKELIALIIKCALKTEYGDDFVLRPGFEKMSAKIANSIMLNPPLRRQILSATNQILENKISKQKNLN